MEERLNHRKVKEAMTIDLSKLPSEVKGNGDTTTATSISKVDVADVTIQDNNSAKVSSASPSQNDIKTEGSFPNLDANVMSKRLPGSKLPRICSIFVPILGKERVGKSSYLTMLGKSLLKIKRSVKRYQAENTCMSCADYLIMPPQNPHTIAPDWEDQSRLWIIPRISTLGDFSNWLSTTATNDIILLDGSASLICDETSFQLDKDTYNFKKTTADRGFDLTPFYFCMQTLPYYRDCLVTCTIPSDQMRSDLAMKGQGYIECILPLGNADVMCPFARIRTKRVKWADALQALMKPGYKEETAGALDVF